MPDILLNRVLIHSLSTNHTEIKKLTKKPRSVVVLQTVSPSSGSSLYTNIAWISSSSSSAAPTQLFKPLGEDPHTFHYLFSSTGEKQCPDCCFTLPLYIFITILAVVYYRLGNIFPYILVILFRFTILAVWRYTHKRHQLQHVFQPHSRSSPSLFYSY